MASSDFIFMAGHLYNIQSVATKFAVLLLDTKCHEKSLTKRFIHALPLYPFYSLKIILKISNSDIKVFLQDNKVKV